MRHHVRDRQPNRSACNEPKRYNWEVFLCCQSVNLSGKKGLSCLIPKSETLISMFLIGLNNLGRRQLTSRAPPSHNISLMNVSINHFVSLCGNGEIPVETFTNLKELCPSNNLHTARLRTFVTKNGIPLQNMKLYLLGRGYSYLQNIVAIFLNIWF